MSNELPVLVGEPRFLLGTGPARQLRNEGKISATLYSKDKEQLFFSLSQKDITTLYRKGYFASTKFLLKVGDREAVVLPKSIDLHPLTDLVINVDFVYLNEEVQEIKIPIFFEGKDTSIGIKRGGFFNITRRKVKVSCRKGAVPQYITAKVHDMKVGTSFKAKDLIIPEHCTLQENLELVVASMLGKVSKETEGETPAK